jgi:hypothetical protein
MQGGEMRIGQAMCGGVACNVMQRCICTVSRGCIANARFLHCNLGENFKGISLTKLGNG